MGVSGQGISAQAAMALRSHAPGLLLCVAIAAVAAASGPLQRGWLGQAWVDPVVVAILLGAGLRMVWSPGETWLPGIGFASRRVLEIGIVLLGASLDASVLLQAGPAFVAGILAVVAASLGTGYALSRRCGLGRRMATLVACGTSICGNSAIAAVAPVIGASSRDVSTAIAYTATLGLLTVLALPALAIAVQLTPAMHGAFTGLTVYAVSQVVAAAAPLGVVAIQLAVVTKLIRVLALGPVCLVLAMVMQRRHREVAASARPHHVTVVVPGFILLFVLLAACRGAGLLPESVAAGAQPLALAFTVVAMVAFGLGCDLRDIGKGGARVAAAVLLSFLALAGFSAGLLAVAGPE